MGRFNATKYKITHQKFMRRKFMRRDFMRWNFMFGNLRRMIMTKLKQVTTVKTKNMDSDAHDQKIDMGKPIERRDFLQGSAFSLAAAVGGVFPNLAFGAGQEAQRAAQDQPGYYPPTRTGMRGSHPGSFEGAHAVKDNPDFLSQAEDTGEHYDLIVVGGGISGLAAAHFYRKEAGADAKILILENHDDFGGHAKRNEFHVDGKLLIMLGGTAGIAVNRWPHGYAPEYNSLIDPDEGLPLETARARRGAIAIANADSGGGAYTDVAIDQAHRAVTELLKAKGS
jgi:spermidine dehydrogenase